MPSELWLYSGFPASRAGVAEVLLQIVAEDGDVAVERRLAEIAPVLVVDVKLCLEGFRDGKLRDARSVVLLGVRDVGLDHVQLGAEAGILRPSARLHGHRGCDGNGDKQRNEECAD